MKCHYMYVPEIGKVLIPGCMGTAAMGIEHCTCRSPQTFDDFERERYNKTVRMLRTENRELERENARLNRIIRNLIKHKNEKRIQRQSDHIRQNV